jgi:hypothetical protein
VEVERFKTTDKSVEKKGNLLKSRLITLEAQIKEAYLSLDGSISMNEKEVLLGILEKERNQILIYNEEKWRQKSRGDVD